MEFEGEIDISPLDFLNQLQEATELRFDEYEYQKVPPKNSSRVYEHLAFSWQKQGSSSHGNHRNKYSRAKHKDVLKIRAVIPQSPLLVDPAETDFSSYKIMRSPTNDKLSSTAKLRSYRKERTPPAPKRKALCFPDMARPGSLTVRRLFLEPTIFGVP